MNYVVLTRLCETIQLIPLLDFKYLANGRFFYSEQAGTVEKRPY